MKEGIKTKVRLGRPPLPARLKAKAYCSSLNPQLLDKLRYVASAAALSQSSLVIQGLHLVFSREPFRSIIKRYESERFSQGQKVA